LPEPGFDHLCHPVPGNVSAEERHRQLSPLEPATGMQGKIPLRVELRQLCAAGMARLGHAGRVQLCAAVGSGSGRSERQLCAAWARGRKASSRPQVLLPLNRHSGDARTGVTRAARPAQRGRPFLLVATRTLQ